jgi:hypothetical protein
MGWLYMQSLGGHSGPRQYLDAQFTYERPDQRVRVLRSSLVKMRTYYAAVEIVPTDGPREVIAVVCLVRYNPRDTEGYVFGYKSMDETMGPCEAECPVAILDLLTPTTGDYAFAWRERCRAATARRAAVPKLRDGDLVVFTEPIRFTDGSEHRRMMMIVDKHQPRAMRLRPPDGGGLYRIGGLERLTFSVVRVS